MVTMAALWLPILLSAIAVFLASAVAWTVMPHHKRDWSPLPAGDRVAAALREAGTTPGQYYFPPSKGQHDKKTDAAAAEPGGPSGYVYIDASATPNMGKAMAVSVAYNLVVISVVAYLAGRTLPPGADYLAVFRVVGTAAWLAYGAAHFSYSIWFSHSWAASWKQAADALVYALIAAGFFGWLWPA